MSTSSAPIKLLDQVRDLLRVKHYSIHTETSYLNWIRRFVLFHNMQHLAHLAIQEHVSASTQNQALNALVFLCRQVLQHDLEGALHFVRVKRPARLPNVLSRAEVQLVLEHIPGEYQLMAKLLYGSGLRLTARISCVAGEPRPSRPTARR